LQSRDRVASGLCGLWYHKVYLGIYGSVSVCLQGKDIVQVRAHIVAPQVFLIPIDIIVGIQIVFARMNVIESVTFGAYSELHIL